MDRWRSGIQGFSWSTVMLTKQISHLCRRQKNWSRLKMIARWCHTPSVKMLLTSLEIFSNFGGSFDWDLEVKPKRFLKKGLMGCRAIFPVCSLLLLKIYESASVLSKCCDVQRAAIRESFFLKCYVSTDSRACFGRCWGADIWDLRSPSQEEENRTWASVMLTTSHLKAAPAPIQAVWDVRSYVENVPLTLRPAPPPFTHLLWRGHKWVQKQKRSQSRDGWLC